jgi:hypothetical protein
MVIDWVERNSQVEVIVGEEESVDAEIASAPCELVLNSSKGKAASH